MEAGTGGESRETGNVAETYPFDGEQYMIYFITRFSAAFLRIRIKVQTKIEHTETKRTAVGLPVAQKNTHRPASRAVISTLRRAGQIRGAFLQTDFNVSRQKQPFFYEDGIYAEAHSSLSTGPAYVVFAPYFFLRCNKI